MKPFHFSPLRSIRGAAAISLTIVPLFLGCVVEARDFYLDPVAGSLGNDGSRENPWPSLAAVMSGGVTLEGGDVLNLMTGNHGSVSIKNRHPSSEITVRAASDQTPTLRDLLVENSSHWTFEGLEISPETVGAVDLSAIVTFNASASDLTLKDCLIYNVKDISVLETAVDYTNTLGRGLFCQAPSTLVLNNHFLNLNYCIEITETAIHTIVRGNLLEGIKGDGIRCLADDSLYEDNVIRNFYGIDDHHDDGIQSWSVDTNGVSGNGVVKGLIIRRNKIFNQTDPDAPFSDTYGVQGIGFFDGFFEDCVIENNLIATDMWHGISIYGATNCRIVHNTVVRSPIHPNNRTPWIGIYDHKTRGPSTGNLVMNNLSSDLKFESSMGTSTANYVSTNHEALFADYANFDFHLARGSQAIDRGMVREEVEAQVPFDLEGVKRDSKPDAGAYEYLDPAQILFPTAEKLSGNRVFKVDWIGTGKFSAFYFPWILHDQHGWWWVGQSSSDAYWFYDNRLGDWLYGSPESPNAYYSLAEQGWVYHFPSSGDRGVGRWFYNYRSGVWTMS